MFHRPFSTIFISCIAVLFLNACGNGDLSKHSRKKIIADSIRNVDSLQKNKVTIENMKRSLQDSILAAQEFDNQVAKYDSLRKMDSLKVKWKRRDPIKPAPKRELWAKSPIK